MCNRIFSVFRSVIIFVSFLDDDAVKQSNETKLVDE